MLALFRATAEARCEPVEQHEGRHEKQGRTHQSITQQVEQMIPRTDHRRIGIEHDDGDLDGSSKPRFECDLFGRIELHEAVDGSIDAHPDEVGFVIAQPCRNGPPASPGNADGGDDQRPLEACCKHEAEVSEQLTSAREVDEVTLHRNLPRWRLR